jgi:colicin import membrane protein
MSSTLALPRHDPLRPPPAPGLGRGIMLALIAHGLLVIGLTAGLNWRSQSEPAFEAELWAAVPVAAAPREETPPEPEPEPVKPTPEPPKPDLRAQQQEQRDAEIAAEREKKKKLEEKKRAEEEAERKKREQELKDKKLKEDRAKQEKQEKAQQEAQKKKAEAALEKQRQDNLKRMMGMAGASGAPNATGTAQQSAGPSASYAGRIKARIRPNIIYSDSGLGNPLAEAEVRTGAGGSITSWKLIKSSGDAEWDKAVLRAIEKTGVLPPDVDGRVPAVLVIAFRPRE